MKRNTAIFLLLCLIWGMTWIGIKAGVDTVPPLMFAGTRFFAAGILIVGSARLRGSLLRSIERLTGQKAAFIQWHLTGPAHPREKPPG